jgi:hypothetical protein
MDNEHTKSSDMEWRLEQELKASLVNGKIPCPVAFKIGRRLKVSPREVGDMANRLNIKISNCQLGCFP